MQTSAFILVTTLSLGMVGLVHAKRIEIPTTKVSMETCMVAALNVQDGDVREVELETVNDVPLYEFDIRSADGVYWEMECSAIDGRVEQVERKLSGEQENANLAKFEQLARIDEAKAKEVALAAVAGKVLEVEREFEMNNQSLFDIKTPVYEVDIETADGHEVEVEVNALTGQVNYIEREIYSIPD